MELLPMPNSCLDKEKERKKGDYAKVTRPAVEDVHRVRRCLPLLCNVIQVDKSIRTSITAA